MNDLKERGWEPVRWKKGDATLELVHGWQSVSLEVTIDGKTERIAVDRLNPERAFDLADMIGEDEGGKRGD